VLTFHKGKIRPLFSLLLLAFSASCSVTKDGAKGPLGTGEGITGRAALTLNNGRVRCDFTPKQPLQYEVTCVAVTVTASGSEVRATEVSEGISLLWQTPAQKDGPDAESLACRVSDSTLFQSCTISLSRDESALWQFSLKIVSSVTNEQAVVADEVRLPYSVRTFGQVPLLMSYQARTEQAETSSAFNHGASRVVRHTVEGPASGTTALGVQAPLIPEESRYVGLIDASCSNKDRTYFIASTYNTGAGKQILVTTPEGTRLFAGAPYASGSSDHRLRIKFTNLRSIACTDGGLYAIDAWSDQAVPVIYFLADDGGVKNVTPEDGAIRAYTANSAAVGPDGSFYFSDHGSRIIWKRTPEGIWSKSRVQNEIPLALAVGSGGDIYYSTGLGIHRLDTIAATSTSLVMSNPTFFIAAFTVDGAGNIYFVGGHQVFKRDPAGVIAAWAGSPVAEPIRLNDCKPAVKDVPRLETTFRSIRSLRARADGQVDISDAYNCQVKRLSGEGKISTVAMVKGGTGKQSVLNPIENAVFSNIRGLVMLKDGTIFFTTSESFQLHKISPDGKTFSHLTLVGLNLETESSGALFVAADASERVVVLHEMTGRFYRCAQTSCSFIGQMPSWSGWVTGQMRFGPDGALYLSRRVLNVADEILKVTLPELSGAVTVSLIASFVHPDITYPGGVVPMVDGSLVYTSGGMDRRVRKIQPNGQDVVVAGNGAYGSGGDGGPALGAAFVLPLDVATDGRGNLFVADAKANRIRMLTPNSESSYQISTLFGGESATDCSGSMNYSTEQSAGEGQIKQALSRLCYSSISRIVVQNSCGEPNGDIKYAFTNGFDSAESIVRVIEPCPTL